MQLLERFRWFAGSPAIFINHYYEKRRSGADMEYRIRTVVEPLLSPSFFGFNILLDITLNGTNVVTGHQIKGNSPNTWSSNITYTSSWRKVTNKTSGTTPLSITVRSNSGDSSTKAYNLPIDPAGSVLGDVKDFDVDGSVTIPITKYNSGFTDNLTIKIGTTTVKTVGGVTNNQSITFTTAEKNNIYTLMKDNASITFTFELKTMSGSTEIGTSTKTAIGSISNDANSKPTITDFSFVPVDEGTKDITGWTTAITTDNGNIILGKTLLQITVSGATPKKNASIAYYKLLVNGNTFTSNTSNIIMNSPLSYNDSLRISVVDSRGFESTVISKSFIGNPYSNPLIETIIAERKESDQQKILFSMSAKVSNVILDNDQFDVSLIYRETGTDTWFNGGNITSQVLKSDGVISTTELQLVPDFDTGKSYVLILYVDDYYNLGNRYRETEISTEDVLIDYKEKSIGIGGVSDQPGLNVFWDATFKKSVNYTTPEGETRPLIVWVEED